MVTPLPYLGADSSQIMIIHVTTQGGMSLTLPHRSPGTVRKARLLNFNFLMLLLQNGHKLRR
jgi:hypothetical protein